MDVLIKTSAEDKYCDCENDQPDPRGRQGAVQIIAQAELKSEPNLVRRRRQSPGLTPRFLDGLRTVSGECTKPCLPVFVRKRSFWKNRQRRLSPVNQDEEILRFDEIADGGPRRRNFCLAHDNRYCLLAQFNFVCQRRTLAPCVFPQHEYSSKKKRAAQDVGAVRV